MTFPSQSLFKPPAGLLPHEEVVWVRQTQSGAGGRAAPALCLFFGLPFLLIGLWAQAWIYAGIGGLIVLACIYGLYTAIKRHGIRFYLTTYRLIKANKGIIIQQLSRSMFKGKPVSQFIQESEAYNGRRRGPSGPRIYNVKVLDPNSGDVVMKLGIMRRDAVDAIGTIASTVYCQYCGRKNDPSSALCSGCGANL